MVNVCIASIPDRVELLIAVIKSLLPQVDRIYLYLNNYDMQTAEKLEAMSDKIYYVIGDNSKGDAGKFFFASKLTGYILTCDDDLLYPPTYVERMKRGIDEHKKSVVSIHGRIMKLPIESYYSGHVHYLSYQKELKRDTPCHVIGTGCMGWHSDTIKVSMDDFPSANMADIHFSVLAKKKNIPLIVLSHRQNWVWYLQPEKTIYGSMSKDDSEHVKRLNEINWE